MEMKKKLLAAAGLTEDAGAKLHNNTNKDTEKFTGSQLWQYGKRLYSRILSDAATVGDAIFEASVGI